MGIFLVEAMRQGLVSPRSPDRTARAALTGLGRATREYVLTDGVRLLVFVESKICLTS